LSEAVQGRSLYIPIWWLVLLTVLLILELAFLVGAYTSGAAGLERVFGVFTGLLLIAFGVILYAGRLIFYD
jgi:hypothetical protein